jgi:hypothetical protein
MGGGSGAHPKAETQQRQEQGSPCRPFSATPPHQTPDKGADAPAHGVDGGELGAGSGSRNMRSWRSLTGPKAFSLAFSVLVRGIEGFLCLRQRLFAAPPMHR